MSFGGRPSEGSCCLAVPARGSHKPVFRGAPQKIFAHLLTFLPTPDQLVQWMSDPAEIDRRVKGTEYWALIDPKAPQQRSGVLGSLNMSADSFRLLPKQEEAASVWTATQWAENRRGWIFITSRQPCAMRFAPHQFVDRHTGFAFAE